MSEKSLHWRRWLLLATAVVGVTITFSLGQWQLGRASEKNTLEDARTQQADKEALDAAFELTKIEGIIPALETAHALAVLPKMTLRKDQVIVRNGRVSECIIGR